MTLGPSESKPKMAAGRKMVVAGAEKMAAEMKMAPAVGEEVEEPRMSELGEEAAKMSPALL